MISRTVQLEGNPTKIGKNSINDFTTCLVKNINTCIKKGEFPDKLRTVDIMPAFKKDENMANQTTDQ